MKPDPITALLLRDPNLADAFKAVFHEDYTPEELAIEAEERRPAEEAKEREGRAELAVELDQERGIWRDGSGR